MTSQSPETRYGGSNADTTDCREVLELRSKNRLLLALDQRQEPKRVRAVPLRKETSDCSPLSLQVRARSNPRRDVRTSPLRQPTLREPRPPLAWNEPRQHGRYEQKAPSWNGEAHPLSTGARVHTGKHLRQKNGPSSLPRVWSATLPRVCSQEGFRPRGNEGEVPQKKDRSRAHRPSNSKDSAPVQTRARNVQSQSDFTPAVLQHLRKDKLLRAQTSEVTR